MCEQITDLARARPGRDPHGHTPMTGAVERLEQLDEEPDERGGREDREHGHAATDVGAPTAGSPGRSRSAALTTDRVIAAAALQAGDTPCPGGRLAVSLGDVVVEPHLIGVIGIAELILIVVLEATRGAVGRRGSGDERLEDRLGLRSRRRGRPEAGAGAAPCRRATRLASGSAGSDSTGAGAGTPEPG